MANRAIDQADSSQQSYGSRHVDDASQTCPNTQDSVEQVVIIPRKPANIFAADHSLKTLLPDRYPGGTRIKKIESNFYPDLNATRTITAVVTHVTWNPATDTRPDPAPGKTVYFAIVSSGAVKCKLSANSASANSEGIASVDLTVRELPDANTLKVACVIEVVASLSPSCAPGNPSVKLTLHRNEDVAVALAASEAPDDFATTLQPVLDLNTWIVRQEKRFVKSNGAIAVQQLLNQVSCRKQGGGHQFVRPDGEFGRGGAAEAGRFLTSFGSKPGPNETTANSYRNCHFGVTIEQDDRKKQGVKTYVEAEYGSYSPGRVIDAYLLVGPQAWARGQNVMQADGLLDLYRAVVWEYLEAGKARADEYAELQTNWYRHPSDSGSANWPATVTQGVSYWYGGARSVEEFTADLTGNVAPEVTAAGDWLHYMNNNNCRIGLHDVGDTVAIPASFHQQFAHLKHQNDPDVSATAPWVLRHPHIDRIMRQYTGIDCSGFCHRIAMEAKFRPGHCADLTDSRICLSVPVLSHANGLVQNRLTTGSWPDHFRAISAAAWRLEVVFRGDVLNSAGHHIVQLETANRTLIDNDDPEAGDLWIFQASGVIKVENAAKVVWPQTECIRRVVYSPLAQWDSAWNAWRNRTTGVVFGRVYLWP